MSKPAKRWSKKLKKFRYTARVRVEGHPVVSQTFDSEDEAILWELMTKKKIEGGLIIDNKTSFVELYQCFLDDEIDPRKKMAISTKIKYHDYKKYIVELFGSTPAAKINPMMYQRAMNRISKKHGFVTNTLRMINSAVNLCIKYALRSDIQIREFTVGVRLNAEKESKDTSEKYIHSEDDKRRLLEYLYSNLNHDEDIYNLLFIFFLHTGFRPREIYGLQWENVNLEEGWLNVVKSYDIAHFCFTPPKTKASVRPIPIMYQEDLELLQDWKEKQKMLYKNYGKSNKNDFVFGHPKYKHDLPSSPAINKQFKKVLISLDIPPITLYGCRHTWGSDLISKGYGQVLVAKALGHTDLQQSQRTYVHALSLEYQEMLEEIRQ